MIKEQIEKLISNFAKRNIETFYFDSLEEAKIKILNMVPITTTVGIGNSQTLKKMNISKVLEERGNTVYDKTLAKNKEEIRDLKRKSLLTDWYITSSNAISVEGHIVNIDHSGNRVAAMIYGPDKVIVVVGRNKIEETLDDAMKRARNHAAPLNAIRAGYNPPCVELKRCVDCLSKDRVCYNVVTIEGQYVPGRMKLIIINEDLGF
ncbi:lactate utilization protein [Wukongibacter baidiensis]|uniref:lactate utilization protein n=1 Tax=Wukongibacter baidiensis TaxID=1723361 RepID=UPI003D7FBBD2